MTVKRMIRTAMNMPGCRQAGTYKTYINMNLDQRWQGARATWETRGDAIMPTVIESTWVIKCPDCPEQIIYEPGEPFYCPECQNVKNDGYARPVKMPDERTEIERVLCNRDLPATRNWLGESVAQLKAENKAHGVNI